jgi:hypothetical protein
MAKKKKSLSQNVVGVATTGMPSPVRKFLGGRLVALLIIAVVPILFATGIVSVRMENGRPKLTFNQHRAAEVRENAVDRAQDFHDDHSGRNTPVADFASDLGIGKEDTVAERFEDAVGDGFGDSVSGFSESVGDRLGDMNEGISENVEQVRHIEFGGEPEKSGFRPFADLKEKATSLRR